MTEAPTRCNNPVTPPQLSPCEGTTGKPGWFLPSEIPYHEQACHAPSVRWNLPGLQLQNGHLSREHCPEMSILLADPLEKIAVPC